MLSSIGTIIASQFIAPTLMFDVPDLHKLTISRVEVRSREVSEDYYDPRFVGPKVEMPERLIIDGFDGRGREWYLGINLEKYTIEAANWQVLLYQDANAHTSNLATVLVGLPSVIITSPLWLGFNVFLKSVEVITGMNHHSYSLWMKLKDQLPTEVRDFVRYALIKKSEEDRQKDND